jgi:signal transduction histidine kinase
VPPGLPQIRGNANPLQQAFMNLVINAWQAMPEGGQLAIRCAKATAEGTGSGTGAGVTVTFRDTGCGISAEDLPRIFEPFFTTKPVGKGTGLGLSLSWGILQDHSARIDVASELGVGTTFTVWFPEAKTAGG